MRINFSVHLKIHIPKLMNKHTHVRTVYRHHFYPKKSMMMPKKMSLHYSHGRADPHPAVIMMVDKSPKNNHKESTNMETQVHSMKQQQQQHSKNSYEVSEDSAETRPKYTYAVRPKPMSQLHTSFRDPYEYIKMTENDHIDQPQNPTTSGQTRTNTMPALYSITAASSNPVSAAQKRAGNENDFDADRLNWPENPIDTLQTYSTLPKSVTDRSQRSINSNFYILRKRI